jgi:hypothetical protein
VFAGISGLLYKTCTRQVRRLLTRMRKVGDKAVVHGLRGRSNRKIDEEKKQQAIELLKEDVYRGFGPNAG